MRDHHLRQHEEPELHQLVNSALDQEARADQQAIDPSTIAAELAAIMRSTSAAPAVPEPEPDGESEADSFWQSLTTSEQRALLQAGQEHTYSPGDWLCRENRPADHVIVIQSGWVKVFVERAGQERILMMRGPGDLVGERASLEVRPQSASIVALDNVQALLISTADFAAVIRRHQQVLTVVERQVERIGGKADQPAAPAQTAPWWTGRNCTIFMADIAGFGAALRTDADRRAVRGAMYRLLREAFAMADVPWAACHREDRGDGVLVVVPPDTPTVQIAERLVDRLAALLRPYNQQASEALRLQLRVAIDVGPVITDADGVVSDAIVRAARMLDAPVLRKELSDNAADLAIIASFSVYDIAIRHGSTEYKQVKVRVKEFKMTAWMTLAGT